MSTDVTFVAEWLSEDCSPISCTVKWKQTLSTPLHTFLRDITEVESECAALFILDMLGKTTLQ